VLGFPAARSEHPFAKKWYGAYLALEWIVREHPDAEGYLWTNDDVALNYWKLRGANKSRIWAQRYLGGTSRCTRGRRRSLRMTGRPRPPPGEVACHCSHVNTTLMPSLYSCSHCIHGCSRVNPQALVCSLTVVLRCLRSSAEPPLGWRTRHWRPPRAQFGKSMLPLRHRYPKRVRIFSTYRAMTAWLWWTTSCPTF